MRTLGAATVLFETLRARALRFAMRTIPDSALRLARVPRPPLGHWMKIEFGRDSPQFPLPAARPGDPLSWTPLVLREKPERRKKEPSPPMLPAQAAVASGVATDFPEVTSDEHVEVSADDIEAATLERGSTVSETSEETACEPSVVRHF